MMTWRSAAAPRVVGIALALVGGCDNSSIYTPYISSVGPGYPLHAGSTQLEVSGKFFAPGVVVFWDGRPQATHFLSSTQLQVDLEAGLTDSAGRWPLTAQNPGSFLCEPHTVEVRQDGLEFTAVSPQQIDLGASDTTLSFTGSGFRATDVVLWNNVPLATTVQSATALVATVPASLLAIPGDGFILIADPACTDAWLCTPRTFTGKAVRVGASTQNRLGNGRISDIAWDATDSLLLASVTDSITGSQTFLAVLDPTSGAFVQQTSAQSPLRWRLAVSDQDRFVYSFGTQSYDAVAPLRYSLPGLSNGLVLTGFVVQPGFPAQQLAPAPAAPETIAVLTGKDFRASPTLQIVDGNVARARTADGTGVYALEWGFDASALYAVPQLAPGVILFKVDGTGITARAVLGSTQFRGNGLHFDRTTRRLYGDYGENVDEAGVDSRPFGAPTAFGQRCAAAIDGGLGKAFYACYDQTFGIAIKSFDLATQRPIANILFETPYSPDRLLRFGSDGLAVLANGYVYIYRGSFVQ